MVLPQGRGFLGPLLPEVKVLYLALAAALGAGLTLLLPSLMLRLGALLGRPLGGRSEPSASVGATRNTCPFPIGSLGRCSAWGGRFPWTAGLSLPRSNSPGEPPTPARGSAG